MARLAVGTLRKLMDCVGSVLSRAAAPEEALRAILEQAVIRTGAERGILVETVTPDGEEFRVVHRVGAIPAVGTDGSSRTILSEVLRTGEPSPTERRDDDAAPPKTVSVLSTPIRRGTSVVGAVQLEREAGRRFAEADRAFLASLLDLVAPLLEAQRPEGSGIGHCFHSNGPTTRRAPGNGDVLSRERSFRWFAGQSVGLDALEETVRKAARTDLPVLLEGETGTGKSILARILHDLGPRSIAAFVTVFCPTLEPGMVENTLFGHRRGAFTGAIADRIGKVQAAERGTLFLDEVGELPLDVQPKLLRLLHEKTYERLGDHQELGADVRIIAATNKDLGAEARAGRFRRDLYERLRWVVVRIPPLRERREDIPRLLRHALDLHDRGWQVEISGEAATFLVESDYGWPGNVREVEQLAARLLLDQNGARPVTCTDIDRLFERDPERQWPASAPELAGLAGLVERAERTILESVLLRNPDLSRSELAAKLRISERSLYHKLRQFGLGREV